MCDCQLPSTLLLVWCTVHVHTLEIWQQWMIINMQICLHPLISAIFLRGKGKIYKFLRAGGLCRPGVCVIFFFLGIKTLLTSSIGGWILNGMARSETDRLCTSHLKPPTPHLGDTRGITGIFASFSPFCPSPVTAWMRKLSLCWLLGPMCGGCAHSQKYFLSLQHCSFGY